jgi:putative membrane protein
MKLIGHLLVNSLALWIVAYLIPGFEFIGWQAILVTAVIMGVVNTFIKPIFHIIALPITVLTFGIAAFFINVILLWLTALIVPGFEITSFLTAVIGSIALSLVSWFLHHLTKEK